MYVYVGLKKRLQTDMYMGRRRGSNYLMLMSHCVSVIDRKNRGPNAFIALKTSTFTE